MVSNAMSSAERVVALRADAGKGLSNVNRESLDGLTDALERLKGLLSDDDSPAPVLDAELAEKRLALAKRENEWRASMPVDLLV